MANITQHIDWIPYATKPKNCLGKELKSSHLLIHVHVNMCTHSLQSTCTGWDTLLESIRWQRNAIKISAFINPVCQHIKTFLKLGLQCKIRYLLESFIQRKSFLSFTVNICFHWWSILNHGLFHPQKDGKYSWTSWLHACTLDCFFQYTIFEWE